MAYFKGEEQFISQILDLKNQAIDNQKIVRTLFLDPYHQKIVEQLIGSNPSLQVGTFGGFGECEYARMVIAPSFYELEQDDYLVQVIRISYPERFRKLEHRDVLGALMSLGLKRELFGDIYEIDRDFYVAIDKRQEQYVISNLKKIAIFSVKIHPVDEIVEGVVEFEKEVFFVSSYRLDKIIATLFKINRSLAVDAIESGMVKVNYKTVEQISFLCNNNDIISFKKHGKVRLNFTERITKSNNFVIEGYFYT